MQLGDARKLDQGTQEALRVRAVFLVEKGATHMEAALAVGVHRGTGQPVGVGHFGATVRPVSRKESAGGARAISLF